MRRLGTSLSLCVLVTCAAPDVLPTTTKPVAIAAVVADAAPDAPAPAPVDAPDAPPEVWLKGSTHVHARPSGDSSTPIPDVLRWYEQHSYDFIVLTDHNRVSQVNVDGIETVAAVAHASAVDGGVDAATVYYSTEGEVAVYDEGPIVLATLMRNTHFEIDEHRIIHEDTFATLRPRGGVPAVVRRRN